MKRYCPTILLLSLLAWAVFATCAWGGGPNDPFAPIGVRASAVSSTGVYTGTGTGTTASTSIRDGLVAEYLPANYVDYGTGLPAVAYDSSGNNRHATQTVDARKLTVVDGAFYGDDETAQHTVFAPPSVTNSGFPITVVAKWSQNNPPNYSCVYYVRTDGSDHATLFWYGAGVNTTYFRIADYGVGFVDTTKAGPLTDVVVTTAHIITDSTQVCYVDGVVVATGTVGTPPLNPFYDSPNFPGCPDPVSGQGHWDGKLYWIRFYSRALSDSEIAAASSW